ncbi:MAG: thiamine pyrophosphate-binding protein [Methylacidiphilales bacterium]|nr:thiamine pyrophosphate-binding protein [Candidatus Methylacidiphilales bacterium]
MIRLADYVAQTLVQKGCNQAFLITGGLAMHLNDAFGLCREITYTCCHHEQSCAMAAEGYARIAGKPAVVHVTGGPGGINTLNGVFGAHTDSIPMLVISGQAKRETCLSSYDIPALRQLGDQEVEIVPMVKGITKYAVYVRDPQSIRYHLERAIHLATHGRPGPCWLDIPVDVQSAQIDSEKLRPYDPAEDAIPTDRAELARVCADVLDRIEKAARPVILAGSGIHLAHALDLFERVAARLGVPVTAAWTAPDVIPTDHPLYCGRPGTVGDRPGNFTVQNSDLVLVLGSRLNIRQVSYTWQNFARAAYKIQVDIDPAELDKPTVKPDFGIRADLKDFLEELERQAVARQFDATKAASWLAWCRERVSRYPAVVPRQREGPAINPYHFIDQVIRRLGSNDIVVCGDATASVVSFQVGFIKRGMRMFANSGSASMGYDIPASIGAAIAGGGRRVVCFAGDGSAHFNIQEIETIRLHRLPIKIFVLNNDGYLSMRLTQGGFFKGNFIGEGRRSGVSFPDYAKVAAAYGLPAIRLEEADFGPRLDKFLALEGPALCEVVLDPKQEFEPKLTSRRLPDGQMVTSPLEDMAPFLSREELAENMLIPPL